MTHLNYTVIAWPDGWSFEETDPDAGHVIFASHTWGYALYDTLDDALHAISDCEAARARVRCCTVDDLGSTITCVRRRRQARAQEEREAEAKLTELLTRYQRTYTTSDFARRGFGAAQSVGAM